MTTTAAKKTAARRPQPPAAAVAQDAHWSSTVERLRSRQRPIATLTICDDPEAKRALADARVTQANVAAHADANPADQAAKTARTVATGRLATAQAAYDAAAIVLRFQALERPVLQDLIDAHKPTEEQAEDGYDFNKDTLGPVLIAASSLDGITPEDAAHFLATWSTGEAEALSNTAFGVQRDVRMELGKG